MFYLYSLASDLIDKSIISLNVTEKISMRLSGL